MQDYTIITPTKNRPECMKVLSVLIDKQTVKPKQWIIVDDGDMPLQTPQFSYITHIRRQPLSSDPCHTITLNMLEALKYIAFPVVLIFEDDDWYREDYAEQMLSALEGATIAGNRPTIHYNLKYRQYVILQKVEKACWCKTGFHIELVGLIKKEIYRDLNWSLIDMPIWKEAKLKYSYAFLDSTDPIHIGFKGMPGQVGNPGMHQRMTKPNRYAESDNDFINLKKWIGKDFELYEQYTK